MTRWVLIAGEYPPRPGGVSDYTYNVARGLAAAGDEVHVLAPQASEGALCQLDGVTVYPLSTQFSRRARQEADAVLASLPSPYVIFLQYVPHGFGAKAMNVPFTFWVWRKRKRARIFTMFHEIVFPLTRKQPLKHNILGIVTRVMAAMVVRASEHIFASTPAWLSHAHALGSKSHPSTWLPVPSNFMDLADAARIELIRKEYISDPSHRLVGHFGTYGQHVTHMLDPLLPAILTKSPQARFLLMGLRSDAYLAMCRTKFPQFADRLYATGPLAPQDVAANLAACDLLVQPYVDGVSTRRGSLMASLALGCAILTTRGELTEPVWAESGGVALAPVSDMPQMADTAAQLIADDKALADLRMRARNLYEERFSLAQTIKTIRSIAGSRQ